MRMNGLMAALVGFNLAVTIVVAISAWMQWGFMVGNAKHIQSVDQRVEVHTDRLRSLVNSLDMQDDTLDDLMDAMETLRADVAISPAVELRKELDDLQKRTVTTRMMFESHRDNKASHRP